MKTERLIVNRSELARLLGRDPHTVDRYVRQGILPSPHRISEHSVFWMVTEVIDALNKVPKRTGV